MRETNHARSVLGQRQATQSRRRLRRQRPAAAVAAAAAAHRHVLGARQPALDRLFLCFFHGWLTNGSKDFVRWLELLLDFSRKSDNEMGTK